MSDTKICGQLANIRYTWPGRDEAICCIECAAGLTNIATAMGFHLQILPLTNKDIADPLEWPTCPQKIKEQEYDK